jgi:hypothetical protein
VPVQVKLSENRRYLVYELADPLDIKDLLEAYRKEREFRDEIPHTMHSIVDMSEVKRIPPNWLVAKAGPGLTHPRSGEMAFVGISMGLKIVVETILKIMQYKRMKFFKTREEAEAYMQKLTGQAASSAG